jgi:predicted RNA binding protein YcfA (HicA-like mRNA interferase family)
VSVISSLSYKKIVSALERAGFCVVRQTGSHIQMIRRSSERGRTCITVPAYKPIPKHLLAKIIKQAGLTVDEFLSYL